MVEPLVFLNEEPSDGVSSCDYDRYRRRRREIDQRAASERLLVFEAYLSVTPQDELEERLEES